MSLRDDDVMLAEFVDALRARGLTVSLKHYRYHDGREVGRHDAGTGWVDASVLEHLAAHDKWIVRRGK